MRFSTHRITGSLALPFAFLVLAFSTAEFISSPGVDTELLFSEGTGTTTADGSGNLHNGTLVNGPLWTTGKYGQGISFDGVNDYVNIPDATTYTLDPTGTYTWSAWVKNTTFKQWSPVWSQTVDASNFFYFYAHTTTDPDGGPVTAGISVYWWNSNGASKIGTHSTNNVLTLGAWSYVTVTYDGTKAQNLRFTIYVNGKDVTDRTDVVSVGTIASLNPTNIRVGSDQPFSEFLNGVIDEVRFYRRLLTTTEITTDMNTGADAIAPIVNLTAPASSAIVAGTVAVTATATDNVGVVGVQFLLDGANLGSEVTTAPYTLNWNTLTVANGPHTLSARARDAAGNSTTVTGVPVTVNNDILPPSVSVSTPTANAVVSGTVPVTANASDNFGVVGVQFLLDGANLGAEVTAAPFTVNWNTTSVANGNHVLTARARDAAGLSTTSGTVTVSVSNVDNVLPSATVTSPSDGATITGTTTLTATAQDNLSVAGVQFLLDNVNLGAEVTAAPYSYSWNSFATANGTHTITARVRDGAGNTNVSPVINITVSNDHSAPQVGLTTPVNAEVVSGAYSVTATATDDKGVVGVQFLLDNVNIGAEVTTAPYAYLWNTVPVTNGSHQLTARARDAAGNTTTSDPVVFAVINDHNPPTINLTAPGASSTVSGTVDLTADATDDKAVVGVQFLVDGVNFGTELTASPWTLSWNTTTFTDAAHVITARARDAAGNTTTATAVSVNVKNDVTPPTSQLTAPANGATVTGTVTVSATATDNKSVAGVQFLLDGANLGAEDVTSPYSVSWNTLTTTPGAHTLTALARDGSGNTTVSTSVAVTVQNTSLVAAYGFSENAGTTTADASGNNNKGTLTNGPLWSASGKYGSAIQFDGSNDLVLVSDANSLDLTAGMTLEAWVQPTTLSSYRTIICKENGTNNLAYALSPNNSTTSTANQRPTSRIRIGSNTRTVTGTAKLATATWTHLASTYDGANLRLYVNGTLVSTFATTGNIAVTTNQLSIGGSAALGGQYFTGLIDEVRIYNRALSAAEIVTDMNTPIAPDQVNPTLSLTAPADGATVSLATTLTATATDNVGVAGVQFLLDGNNLGTEVTAAPYTISWNTVGVPNGPHILGARARDAAGNIGTATPVNVTVGNDITPPQVALTAPADGASVTGSITISATATDDKGVAGVQFLLDGTNVGNEVTTAPYTLTWNSALTSNGAHALTARARDQSSNPAVSLPVNITVTNANPVVQVSNVTAGSLTFGSATITWNTNVPADGQVQFGTTATYGQSTLRDPTMVTAHSQVISGLLPGTTYHYIVQSTDVNSLVIASTDLTFTTPKLGATIGTLNGHAVNADASGKIIPWTPNPALGFDTVMYLDWDFLVNKVPNDPSTGKPAYYSRSYINTSLVVQNWPHNPAGLYGMLTESAVKYFGYSGNAGAMTLAEAVATWHLDHGMTLPTDSWASVPYSSGDAGSLTYAGAVLGNTSSGVGDGQGILQPDKVGELGYAFLLLYKYDGNTRFLNAAIQCADVLAAKVRTGTQTQSPWPFRVKASDNTVSDDYCANVVGPVRLLDELIASGLGNTANYQAARTKAWTWLMTFPMVNNLWANYFEDMANQSSSKLLSQGGQTANLNQYDAMMTARYLLEHPEFDASWETHVRGLVSWVETKFGVADFGASSISEQTEFSFPMGSHTSRYASVNALLYEKTGDLAAKEKAYRSFNWATYMSIGTGVTIDGPQVNNVWFTDGYGDYVRHFMTGLGAVPEWVPFSKTALVRSGSVVKAISYGTGTVSYTTYDGAGVDVLHLNFTPTIVTANGVALQQRTDLTQAGWTLDPATRTFRISHPGATQIVIGSTPVAPLVQITSIANRGTYAVGADSLIQLEAKVTDVHHPDARLHYEWSRMLVRNGRAQATAADTTHRTKAWLNRAGCLGGQERWVITLKVTNPDGLSGTDTVTLYPDCVGLAERLQTTDAGKSRKILIAPNPSRGNLMFQYHTEKDGPVNVRITDMEGRLVGVADRQVWKGSNQVDLSGMPRMRPGLYIVTVMQDGKMLRAKWMVAD